MELTSGFVAGIIAAAILTVKLLVPTALTFILATSLKDEETAATWTAVCPPLQSSFWPIFLGADTTQSLGVRKFVRCITMAIPAFAILVSVASVVTPLGLYETEVLSREAAKMSFMYARDESPIFSGTSSRNGWSFTRRCYLDSQGSCRVPCPYDENGGVIFFNGTYPEEIFPQCLNSSKSFNVTVSNSLREIYSSGTNQVPTTVSNFFDIEWRQLVYKRDNRSNNGEPMPAGGYRFLESFALTDSFNIVEGLIVDAKNGAIGFRNHTVPVNLDRTSYWSEDILFIEPSTTCVNQNISLDFNVSVSSDSYSGTTITGLALTDHGGFANFNKTADVFKYQMEGRENLNTPNLHARAYMASWYANALTMVIMNVTNLRNETSGAEGYSYIHSEVGKQFKLFIEKHAKVDKYQSLGLLQDLSEVFQTDNFNASGSNGEFPGFSNPWNMSHSNFSIPIRLCEDSYPNYPTKLNYTYTACNVIRGVPRRLDGGPSMIFEDGSSWSSPLYTCASGIRATVKTVSFSHNGTTEGIRGLIIHNIDEKNYSREADMPLWGVENAYLPLSAISRIWGIVDEQYQGTKNISTIRQPSLYLPAGQFMWEDDLDYTNPRDNLPAGIAPIAAMNTVLRKGLSEITGNDLFDYVGRNSMSLWLKWRTLSSSPDTVPQILKLLWTDVAASAMVGTKGVLGHYNFEPDRAADIKVRKMVRQVMYHYEFGIPAYLAALCFTIVLGVLLLSTITQGLDFGIASRRLKQTSLGRVIVTLTLRDHSDFSMTSKRWSQANGIMRIYLDASANKTVVEENEDTKNPNNALLQQSTD
ncbi:hypothetical protein VFPPC_06856 [Pochonia chlamydosporia 170]|uniref:Uncharacterized protein n=1 Tax=Pochonia chlamydosporia 170 TaxID=1380566 RepID=A0A179F5T9_METCM|nr:hypothetical protein VFPPC_06856 [Pochonia chlamydosporia 170]OAQ60762.1 hypothetical protein VFPPC_06856 [Pochonia chlamydosporia 170]